MTEAIFGLVGVVVGGLLNGGVSWLTERQKARAGSKIAARLVLAEAEINEIAVGQAVNGGKMSPICWGSVEEWRKHRVILAATLSADEWTCVKGFCTMFEHLQLVANKKPEAVLDDEVIASIHKGITKPAPRMREALERRS